MARATLRRRTPSMEQLESRMVLSASGPNHEVTLMIDTLSRMRMNPAQAAEWVEQHADGIVQANLQHYGVNLNEVKSSIASSPARQPLAYSPELTVAAQGHSDDMAKNNFQSHQSSDGRDLNQRLDQAGFEGRLRYSENAFAYADSQNKSPEGYLDNALQAFLIDWGVPDAGHRRNILEPDDKDDDSRSDEAGIGLSYVKDPIRERAVVVQNFGSRHGRSGQLTGVVFEDRNGDGEFSYREGRGDVEISVKNLINDETKSVQPWEAGMYQIPLAPGSYEVSLEVDGNVVEQKPVRMGAANQKVDFNLTELRSRSIASRARETNIMAETAPAPREATPAPRIEATPVRRVDTPATRPVTKVEGKAEVRVTASNPQEARDTQLLADLIASGLLDNLNSLTINSAASWRAR